MKLYVAQLWFVGADGVLTLVEHTQTPDLGRAETHLARFRRDAAAEGHIVTRCENNKDAFVTEANETFVVRWVEVGTEAPTPTPQPARRTRAVATERGRGRVRTPFSHEPRETVARYRRRAAKALAAYAH